MSLLKVIKSWFSPPVTESYVQSILDKCHAELGGDIASPRYLAYRDAKVAEIMFIIEIKRAFVGSSA